MFEQQPFEREFEREKHVYRRDEFSELLKDAVRFFHGTPVCKFPPEERFTGAGVYAIYYIGKTGLYAKFGQEINRQDYRLPIYVGKAEPTGSRKGDLEEQLTTIKTLILGIRGLRLKDFRLRIVDESSCVIYGDVYTSIKRKYRPIWNRLMPRKLEKSALESDEAKLRIRHYLEVV